MFLHRLVQSCQQSIIQRDTLDSRRDSIFQDKTRFSPERRLEHANIVCEYSIHRLRWYLLGHLVKSQENLDKMFFVYPFFRHSRQHTLEIQTLVIYADIHNE